MLVLNLVRKENVKDLIMEGAAICENNAKKLIVKHTFEDSIHKVNLSVWKIDEYGQETLWASDQRKKIYYIYKECLEKILSGLKKVNAWETKCEVCIQGN